MSEVLCMRTSLCFLLLAIGGLPLAAQPDRRMFPARNFPPEVISQDELPRDIVRVASARQVRVDFENDRTRVLRLTLAAGETIPTHDDRSGVLVCLAGCRVRFKMPGGDTQDVELKAGETRWMPDARRAARNLAGGPLEMLYIESKRPST
jgi:quercetin dioxygenase-like cupin family protein